MRRRRGGNRLCCLSRGVAEVGTRVRPQPVAATAVVIATLVAVATQTDVMVLIFLGGGATFVRGRRRGENVEEEIENLILNHTIND